MRILNENLIKKYLRGIAKRNERLGDYLIMALVGPLKAQQANLEILQAPLPQWPESLVCQFNKRSQAWARFHPDPYLDNAVRHIADWIKAAMVNDEIWLKQTDAKGRPLKLAGIQSIDEATLLANEALLLDDAEMASAQTVWAGRDEEREGHIEPVMELENDHRIVRLKTSEALDRESAFLGHCIGKGGYDELLASSDWAYYSLRDRYNRPHATFEIETKTNILHQCKGAQNAPPVEKYYPYVQKFVRAHDFDLEEDAGCTGLLKKDGEYYDLFNLPENLYWIGNIVAPGIKRKLCLPKGLTVTGSLALKDCTGLNNLPDDMSIGCNLYLSGCTSLTSLPEKLFVTGNLTLSGCIGLTDLPVGLSVLDGLDLSECTGLTNFPNNMPIAGNLNLGGCTGLSSLPEDLSVGGDLTLRDCTGLTSLPDGLSVTGNLGLGGCTSLTRLPDGLSVNGDLALRDCTELTNLPKGLTVGGSLALIYCGGLTCLPEGLSFGNNLKISHCKHITSLPEDLSIRGGLELRCCPNLTSLPKGLSVGGNFTVRDFPGLVSLPKGLSVGGYIEFLDCAGLTSLPEGLSVGGYLSIRNLPKLISLPDDLMVGGSLYTRCGTFAGKSKLADARAAFKSSAPAHKVPLRYCR